MRILYLGITALVLLIGGYVLWWFHVADTMRLLAEDWKQQRLSEGYQISHDPLTTDGFPYRVRITTDNINIANPEHFQNPKAYISQFWAVVQPWKINHVIFGVKGTSRADWLEGGVERTLDMAAVTSLGSATFNGRGRLETVAIDITGIQAAPSWREPVTADRIQIHGRPTPLNKDADEADNSKSRDQQIAVRINNMTIEGMDDFPLGKKIENFSLSTNLEGTVEKLPSAETLSKWRDKGGKLDINSLKITWGHGKIEGDGRLQLDSENRPAGVLESRISGYEKILAALTSTGQVDPDLGRTIGFALNLLARDGEDGTRYLKLPLTAQDGGIYLGPIFLMRLQPLFKKE